MSHKPDIEILISAFQDTVKWMRPEDQGLRELCGRAAWMLNECRSAMALASTQLAAATKLRAGLQDSLSRHEEIARQKNLTMEEQAKFLRQLLTLRTPGYEEGMDVTAVIDDGLDSIPPPLVLGPDSKAATSAPEVI